MQGLGFFLFMQVAAAVGKGNIPSPTHCSSCGCFSGRAETQVEGVSLTADGFTEKKHESNWSPPRGGNHKVWGHIHLHSCLTFSFAGSKAGSRTKGSQRRCRRKSLLSASATSGSSWLRRRMESWSWYYQSPIRKKLLFYFACRSEETTDQSEWARSLVSENALLNLKYWAVLLLGYRSSTAQPSNQCSAIASATPWPWQGIKGILYLHSWESLVFEMFAYILILDRYILYCLCFRSLYYSAEL